MSTKDDESRKEYADALMGRIEYLENNDTELKALMGETFSESVINIANTIPLKYSEHASVTCFIISSWLIDKERMNAR